MDDDLIANRLENIDLRLDRIEQILPGLATKEELRLAIEPLATKAELAALATKADLAALATKAELATLDATLRAEIREEGARSRRHMDVLIEGQRSDIQQLAEHLSVVMTRLADR